jgi:hypothetical protein
MRLNPFVLFAALAVPSAYVGCASDARNPDVPAGVMNAQPVRPSVVQDQGRDVLVEADRQMKDLAQLSSSPDPFVQDAISRQMTDLRARSDKLLDDMTIDDGRVHDTAILADVTNLRRTMTATANAEKQAESRSGSSSAP